MQRGRGTGQLRIISGALKGRRIRTLPSDFLRPTSDRAREALFDIIGQSVRGASFLDVCAGTGAVGIEALSRGARSATFIERDEAALDVLRQNLLMVVGAAGTATDRSQVIRVIEADLSTALALLSREEGRFDVIFLDPPYGGGELRGALRLIREGDLAAPDGSIVAEHDSADPPPTDERLLLLRTARYGRAALSFYGSPVRPDAHAAVDPRGHGD